MTQELASRAEVRAGALVIRPGEGVVANDRGEVRPLQPQVMRVLLTFLDVPGRTLSKAELRDACWDGRITGDDAMERVIGRIRRVNAELGPAFALETVPKVGYRLVLPEEPAAETALLPTPALPVAEAAGPDRRRVLAGVAGLAGLTAIGGGVLAFGTPERGARGPLRITLEPLRDGARADAENIANGLTSALQAALDRIDGVRLTLGGAADDADYLISGDVASGGTGREAVVLVRRPGGGVRFSRRFAWTGAAIADPLLAEVVAAVAGLAGPLNVTARHPAYQRDPVAVRDIGTATGLLERTRELLMQAQPGAAHRLAAEAAALVDRTLALDRNDPGALVAAAALARNGWRPEAAAEPLTAMERVTQARGWLGRALLADPNDPRALTALADIYRRYDLRWDDAERMLGRALLGDPDLVEAHWTSAYMLGTLGRAVEGLEHARRTRAAAPGFLWRRIGVPRLLYLVGRTQEALALYDAELRRAPANAFLIRELYLMHLAEADAAALQRLARRVTALAAGAALPGPAAALVARTIAAADAIAGKPAGLAALVDADVARYDAPRRGPPATQGGRASIDELFIFALEAATCGRAGQAVTLLGRALQGHALYWPASLPFGRAQFPAAVRARADFAGLWEQDPRLAEFVERRRAAILGRQMAGVLPGGTRVVRARGA